MKMFQDYSLHWWQFGLLKTSLIAFGILIGSYWADYFKSGPVVLILWAVFLIPSLYLITVTLKQAAKSS